MLDFFVNHILSFLVGCISFYRTLIVIWLLLFLVMVYQFPQNYNFNFAFLLVSPFPNHRWKVDTATHDIIVPLLWNQSRFYLWTFCCLCGRDKGLSRQFWALGLLSLNYSWLTKKVSHFAPHCEKYRNFTWFPGVEILRKGTAGNQVKLRYFSQHQVTLPNPVHFIIT